MPRKSVITIYIAIIRPYLDYEDILYDQPNNNIFCQKIESVQYKIGLAITGAIQGTSQEKRLGEFGLQTLKSRRWLRRLCCEYEIIILVYPNTLPILFPKVKLVTILEMKISLFLIVELTVLKIHFSHILLRLGLA